MFTAKHFYAGVAHALSKGKSLPVDPVDASHLQSAHCFSHNLYQNSPAMLYRRTEIYRFVYSLVGPSNLIYFLYLTKIVIGIIQLDFSSLILFIFHFQVQQEFITFL